MFHCPLPCQFTRRRACKWIAVGCLLAVLLPFLSELLRIYFGNNIHVIAPGKLYRSAQLSPEQLADFVTRHGIRTVVNLRGSCPTCDWYLNQCRAMHDVNVAQEDIFLSACRYPSTTELRRLVDVFDRGLYPMLLHCHQGADRTGLAGTIYECLQPGVDYAVARRQLSPRYGHVPLARTARLDHYLGFYEDWLSKSGQKHTPATLRRWLAAENSPGWHQCRIELLDEPRVAAGQPFNLRVRVHNLGQDTWHLKPSCGTSLLYILSDCERHLQQSERAGLFWHDVPAQGSVDLTLSFNACPPGRYQLFADLNDPLFFYFQMGSQPLDMPLDVVATPTAAEPERIVDQHR